MATDERTVLEQNKAVVRRYLEEVYRGNYAVLDEVISPEYYADRPPDPAGLAPGARYAAGFDRLRRAFPDIRISIDALIAEDDLVAVHATLRGTHLGEFRGAAHRQAGDADGHRLPAGPGRPAGGGVRHLGLAHRPGAAGGDGDRGGRRAGAARRAAERPRAAPAE